MTSHEWNTGRIAYSHCAPFRRSNLGQRWFSDWIYLSFSIFTNVTYYHRRSLRPPDLTANQYNFVNCRCRRMSPAGVSQCTTAHMSCLVRSGGLVHSHGLPVHNSGCEFLLVSEDIVPRLREQLTHVHFLARAPKAEVMPLDACHGHTTLVDAHQTRLATGTTRKPFLTKHRL